MASYLESYANRSVLVTGGLGFIGSNLCRRLADLGALVTAVDSLLPEYGGNLFNLEGYEDKVRINIADVRGHGMERLADSLASPEFPANRQSLPEGVLTDNPVEHDALVHDAAR